MSNDAERPDEVEAAGNPPGDPTRHIRVLVGPPDPETGQSHLRLLGEDGQDLRYVRALELRIDAASLRWTGRLTRAVPPTVIADWMPASEVPDCETVEEPVVAVLAPMPPEPADA